MGVAASAQDELAEMEAKDESSRPRPTEAQLAAAAAEDLAAAGASGMCSGRVYGLEFRV